MRSLLLAACLLTPLRASADVLSAPPAAPADWHKAALDDAAVEALREAGYRLEKDGRVLDPKTKAALTDAQLAAALTALNLGAQRIAVERLRLLLAKDAPGPEDRAEIAALEEDLPADIKKALAVGRGTAELRALADADAAQLAAYFDGTRTAAQRRENSLPVREGAPGPRTPLPYFDAPEQALGDALRAAAAKEIGADPYGRTVLARLNDAKGRPDLPPIVVEDLSGGDVAFYDYRRRALVVDRSTLLDSVVEDAPGRSRAGLRGALGDRRALLDYLNAHPQAVSSFAAKNDALLVHELTHAWQDRRDPVMQEMARGTLPQALVLDDEIEAWTVKNLYVGSKLRRDPAAAVDPVELADYQDMVAGYAAWRRRLEQRYAGAAVNAMDLKTAAQIQDERLALARRRAADTRDAQTAKAQDLAAMTRAQRELADARAAQERRLQALAGTDAPRAADAAWGPLARRWLAAARSAPNPVERQVALEKAEAFARKSGDAKLLAEVRARKGAAE